MKATVPAVEGEGTAARLMSRIELLQAWHDKGRASLPLMQIFLNAT
jgi:hypothetical protein